MLRMPIHGVRMITERVCYRGPHGQESEEERESHQESRKEDFKEKEVVVLATERLRPYSQGTQNKPSPKDLKGHQPFGDRGKER